MKSSSHERKCFIKTFFLKQNSLMLIKILDEMLRLRHCTSGKIALTLQKKKNGHLADTQRRFCYALYTPDTSFPPLLQLVPGGLQSQRRPGEADVPACGGLPHTGQPKCSPGRLLHLCQVPSVCVYVHVRIPCSLS